MQAPEWVFLRHGQSVGNVRRQLVAPADSPLTEHGLAQVDACVPVLRDLGVQAIVSSPMLRARQTAERVAAALGGLEISLEDGLVERSFGELDRWTMAQVRASSWDPVRTSWHGAAPGGETLAEVAARVLAALATPRRHPTLVVAHAGSIRAVLGLIDGVDTARIGRIRVPHCEPLVRVASRAQLTRLRDGLRVVD